MDKVILDMLLVLTMIIISVIVDRKSKKRHAETVELTKADIDASKEVVKALRENTKAIENGDLLWKDGHQISKGELIGLLRSAWIADQRNSKDTTPFVEWLMKEVSNG